MLKQVRNLVRAIVPWNRPYEVIEIMVATCLNAKKKGYGQFLRSSLSAIEHSDGVMGLPVHVTVEPISFCNLECPVCETGAGIIKRQQGTMSMDLYARVITEVGKYANIIFLYWMGEPFLNKNIYKKESLCLKSGKEFHKKVQDYFQLTNRDGEVLKEKIFRTDNQINSTLNQRMDILVDDLGDMIAIIEVKNTDWE